MKRFILGCAGFAAAALTLCPPAAADPASAPPSWVVSYAARNESAMCSTLDAYPTFAGVTGLVLGIERDGLTPTNAGQAVALGIDDGCPYHDDLILSWAHAAMADTPANQSQVA